MVFEFHRFATTDNATKRFSEYLALLGFYFKRFNIYLFLFQKASKGNKLQKLHHAALSGNEDEVQKLLGKGVGKRKL